MAEVIEHLQQLIRIDTSNSAEGGAVGEAVACDYLADLLTAAGYRPERLCRPDAPDRPNLVLRLPGADPALPALLVHAHLDTVPAEPERWSVDPWSGEQRDGYVWGRGATDMKDMCAAVLTTLLEWGRAGQRPRRDLLIAFVADEETDGAYGAEWLVDAHPELFDDVAAAIGESGAEAVRHEHADGHPVTLYPVAAAERGTLRCRLRAEGTAGHASRPSADTAVARLVAALQRVAEHRWPIALHPVVRAQLAQTAAALGVRVELDTDAGVEAAVEALGTAAVPARWTVRASATPTVLRAGYAGNVIPGSAEAVLDVRCPPGYQDRVESELRELIGPEVAVEATFSRPVAAPLEGPWLAAMADAVHAVDPAGVVLPMCLGGGTDAKAFSRLGIDCYGFAPLGADPDGRRGSGMHGDNERVPVESLVLGQRMLAHFLGNV